MRIGINKNYRYVNIKPRINDTKYQKTSETQSHLFFCYQLLLWYVLAKKKIYMWEYVSKMRQS